MVQNEVKTQTTNLPPTVIKVMSVLIHGQQFVDPQHLCIRGAILLLLYIYLNVLAVNLMQKCMDVYKYSSIYYK